MALLIAAVLLIGAAIALWVPPRNSRWRWKLLGRVAAGLLMCASALSLLLFLFSVGMCGRYEFPPIASRDGKFVARVSEEDCGAADSFHSSVQNWQNRQGIFARVLGKKAHATTIFTIGHDPRLIDVSWKDDRRLLIRYPNDSRYPAELDCHAVWEAIHVDCLGYTPDYSKPVGKMPPIKRLVW